jgi:hypothetical protein
VLADLPQIPKQPKLQDRISCQRNSSSSRAHPSLFKCPQSNTHLSPTYQHTLFAIAIAINTPTSPLTPPPLEPLRLGIKPYQRLGAHIILLPKQLRNIHIERTIRLRTRQQLMHTRQRRSNSIRRRPRLLQQIEADLACLEVDVRVANWGYKADCGRGERVGGRDVDGEFPEAAWVGG